MKFYGVRRGRRMGVYDNWTACREQVFQYPNAEYKSFATQEAAQHYVETGQTPPAFLPQDTKGDMSPAVHVWVDGACIQQKDGSLRIGWGLLITQEGEEIHRDKGNDIPLEALNHRNVAGEIWAILKALEWCRSQNIRELTIHYDYQGLESWATGAWKTNLPLTQSYAKQVRASGIEIAWKKVKAHTGIPENELADQLAKEGARMAGNPGNT